MLQKRGQQVLFIILYLDKDGQDHNKTTYRGVVRTYKWPSFHCATQRLAFIVVLCMICVAVALLLLRNFYQHQLPTIYLYCIFIVCHCVHAE